MGTRGVFQPLMSSRKSIRCPTILNDSIPTFHCLSGSLSGVCCLSPPPPLLSLTLTLLAPTVAGAAGVAGTGSREEGESKAAAATEGCRGWERLWTSTQNSLQTLCVSLQQRKLFIRYWRPPLDRSSFLYLLSSSLPPPLPPSLPLRSPGSRPYYCEVCEKQLNGPKPFQAHMASKAHKEEVALLESQ